MGVISTKSICTDFSLPQLPISGGSFLLLSGALLSPVIWLAAQQANKFRDQLLGQGVVTLFGKPARLRRWWTRVPKNLSYLS